MIRYYEGRKLISSAGRTAAGYRLYSEQDVHTLRFIRRARDLGFSVDGIAQLLSLWADGTRHSADVRRMASEHIAQLRHRIAELESMAGTLATLVACCSGDQRPQCPILADIETGAPLALHETRRRLGAATGMGKAAKPAASRDSARRKS